MRTSRVTHLHALVVETELMRLLAFAIRPPADAVLHHYRVGPDPEPSCVGVGQGEVLGAGQDVPRDIQAHDGPPEVLKVCAGCRPGKSLEHQDLESALDVNLPQLMEAVVRDAEQARERNLDHALAGMFVVGGPQQHATAIERSLPQLVTGIWIDQTAIVELPRFVQALAESESEPHQVVTVPGNDGHGQRHSHGVNAVLVCRQDQVSRGDEAVKLGLLLFACLPPPLEAGP